MADLAHQINREHESPQSLSGKALTGIATALAGIAFSFSGIAQANSEVQERESLIPPAIETQVALGDVQTQKLELNKPLDVYEDQQLANKMVVQIFKIYASQMEAGFLTSTASNTLLREEAAKRDLLSDHQSENLDRSIVETLEKSFLKNLGLTKAQGVKEHYYIFRDHEKLPEAVKQDIDAYTKLESATYKHLIKEIGDKRVSEQEFSDVILSYLSADSQKGTIPDLRITQQTLVRELSAKFYVLPTDPVAYPALDTIFYAIENGVNFEPGLVGLGKAVEGVFARTTDWIEQGHYEMPDIVTELARTSCRKGILDENGSDSNLKQQIAIMEALYKEFCRVSRLEVHYGMYEAYGVIPGRTGLPREAVMKEVMDYRSLKNELVAHLKGEIGDTPIRSNELRGKIVAFVNADCNRRYGKIEELYREDSEKARLNWLADALQGDIKADFHVINAGMTQLEKVGIAVSNLNDKKS